MSRTSKKKSTNTLRLAIIIILFLIIAISGYKIITILSDYHDVTVANEEVREEYVKRAGTEEGLPEIDFEGLQAMNPDIIGWIFIPDTNVDFPILKGTSNDSYLYHNYKREYSFAGSIFMDVRCSADFTDLETMVYGHNMHNGDMFGRLKKYEDTDYLEGHKDVYILLPGNQYIHYLADVGKYVSVNDDIYLLPQTGEAPETLVLSTCTDDSSDVERFVLIASYEGKYENE